jgi:hypothetical protein
MGYTKSDVFCVRWKRECHQPTVLTDRSKRAVTIHHNQKADLLIQCTVWNRICPILEPLVLERKRERLEREMGEV